MRNSFWLQIISLVLICTSCSMYGQSTEGDFEKLHTELKRISEIGLIKGYGVAIVSKDSTLFAQGYGFSDVQNNIPYTLNTTQNIGSVSKTLIGVALLKAQEMGKLNLNEPINNYLDFEVVNPSFKKEPIRIWHLATHTGTKIFLPLMVCGTRKRTF